ncbi:MAG: Hsp70 family protein [Acidimicrobiales bacterium]
MLLSGDPGWRPSVVIDPASGCLAEPAALAVRLRDVYDQCCQAAGEVASAVHLSHPPMWDDEQRRALLTAAASAEIPGPELVAAPVAAARFLHRTQPVPLDAHVLVVDVRAAAVTATVVRAAGDGFVVLGRPQRDTQLGGDAWDRALAAHLCATHLPPHITQSLAAPPDPAWQHAAQQFDTEIRNAKHRLAGSARAEFVLSTPHGTGSIGIERDGAFTVLTPLLQAAVQLAERALVSAGIASTAVVAVLVTGGAGRFPLVASLLGQRFGPHLLQVPADHRTIEAAGAAMDSAMDAAMDAAMAGSTDPTSAVPPSSLPLHLAPPAAPAAPPPTALSALPPPGSTATPAWSLHAASAPAPPPTSATAPPSSGPIGATGGAALAPIAGSAIGPSWGPPLPLGSPAADASSLASPPDANPPAGGSPPGRGRINPARRRTVALAVAAVFVLLTGVGVVVLATRDANPSTDRASASATASTTTRPRQAERVTTLPSSTSTSTSAAPATTVAPTTAPPTTAAAPPVTFTPQGLTGRPNPTSMEQWESLWATERAAMVAKIKAGGFGISADGRSALLAADYAIDLSTCPAGWNNTEGLDNNQIVIGHTTAQSGTLALYGQIAAGIQLYLAEVNNAGGITDAAGVTRTFNLRVRDDGYDSARTIPLVDEFINSKQVFSLVTLGSPNTMRTYDKVNRSCIPQPLSMTGHPAWGDPINHPWTSGEQMAYTTEAQLWGRFLENHSAELLARDGKITVAAVVMNNDFGRAYRDGFHSWMSGSPIAADVEFVPKLIEPSVNAAGMTTPMADLAAANPEVFIAMTAGTSCTEAIVNAGRNGLKATANYLFQPSVCKSNAFLGRDKVGGDGAASDGWWVVGGGVKALEVAGYDSDPWAQKTRAMLSGAGVDWATNPTHFVGAARWGWSLEQLFKVAAQLDGGLSRVNLMVALRNMDMTAPFLMEGLRFNLNGSADAFLTEGSEFAQYESARQSLVQRDQLIDLSGSTPSCAWIAAAAECG